MNWGFVGRASGLAALDADWRLPGDEAWSVLIFGLVS